MTKQARIGTWARDGSGPGAEHRRLEVFIGKWINEGETIASPENPAAKIVTNDVYELMSVEWRSSASMIRPASTPLTFSTVRGI